MIWLITALLTKHFVVDFVMQPKWMWSNKGKFGHPGGLAHAGFHSIVTLYILLGSSLVPDTIPGVKLAVVLSAAEFAAHYSIDWAKMNLNAKMGWGATTSPYFWWLLGFDQWLHNLCYLAIVAIVAPY